MYVLHQKFLKVNHTFKHIHLIMEKYHIIQHISPKVFDHMHMLVPIKYTFPPFLTKNQKNYKENGHMPRFLPETNMWQKKEEMNVERWGDNKCKRWVWWGKPKGCGEHGARVTSMPRAIGQHRMISSKRKGKSCFSWSITRRHVARHGGLWTWAWAYMHVAGMHMHEHMVAWVYMIEFIWNI
jgi:hypothetical protein